jgi:hypothetical protein
MGARYPFSCNACGYSADVSGGPDGGETIRTVTITCATCKKLRDVTVGDVMAGEAKAPARSASPRCPGSRTRVHETRLWTHPGPCPRCGSTPMVKGEGITLWD